MGNGHIQKYLAPFSAGESPSVDIPNQFTVSQIAGDSSGDLLTLTTNVKVYSSTGAALATITPPSPATTMLYEQ
jgi:hypothetical protein